MAWENKSKVAVIQSEKGGADSESIKTTIDGTEYIIKVDEETKRPVFLSGTETKKFLLEGDDVPILEEATDDDIDNIFKEV